MSPEIVALLGFILGGGVAGSYAAFRKVGPETTAIATESLIRVNEELRKEIGRLSIEVEKLRAVVERGAL
jgi:hypothetical protein